MEKPRDFMINPANLITFCRFPLSAALLFLPAMSVPFGIVYLLCGISDMTDGFIARKTHKESATGAKLDSAADLLFFAVCTIKILPVLRLVGWIWTFTAVIAVIKVTGMVLRFLRFHTFSPPHSVMNKITGVLLFLLPLTAAFADINRTAAAVCIVAFLAAIADIFSIRKDFP